jgi:hypothetical protein
MHRQGAGKTIGLAAHQFSTASVCLYIALTNADARTRSGSTVSANRWLRMRLRRFLAPPAAQLKGLGSEETGARWMINASMHRIEAIADKSIFQGVCTYP